MTELLLEYFRARANPKGLVVASESRILGDLGVSRDDLVLVLKDLEARGLIRILSTLPYLVLKWSSSNPHRDQDQQQISGNSASVHVEVPVSRKAAAAMQQEDGGAGEGEALLDEVLQVLGPDADRDAFQAILSGRSPELIHRCLQRVRATKAIRVSRAALFRSLLQKLSH